MVYEGILARLQEERLAHKLSQEELGRQLKITQGHYSKAENAIKRFTFYEVKCLAESDLDLYYIYTGRRVVHKHSELLKNSGYREVLCYLHVLLSLECNRYGEQKKEAEPRMFRMISRLKYISGIDDIHENVFMLIRRFEKKTQFEMADCLGMDVKKYRTVEKGISLPDSELLFKVYAQFDVSPGYFLKDRRGICTELEYYLSLVDPRLNGTIYRYFRLLREFYAVRKVLREEEQEAKRRKEKGGGLKKCRDVSREAGAEADPEPDTELELSQDTELEPGLDVELELDISLDLEIDPELEDDAELEADSEPEPGLDAEPELDVSPDLELRTDAGQK